MILPKISLLLAAALGVSQAFLPPCRYEPHRAPCAAYRMASDDGDAPAGSFFNEVPDDDDKKSIDESLNELIKDRKSPPKATEPSTIDGVPTSQATGFAKQPKEGSKSKKPYIGVGPPDNNPTNPEYDDQGYMLYADEETGEKSRVFEALVEYPSVFTMKIVGANEGTFVEDMVQVVADSCEKDVSDIEYSTKVMGKWTSVTVEAPVENAEMLYALYENVDKDPRVKFKF